MVSRRILDSSTSVPWLLPCVIENTFVVFQVPHAVFRFLLFCWFVGGGYACCFFLMAAVELC